MNSIIRKSRVAIVVGEFNSDITGSLLRCCRQELLKHGVREKQISVVSVPGAYELPFAAQKLAKTKKFAAVICLGCVIKGETSHDIHVATWASVGIGQASLNTGVPILFGVLTPRTEAQARKRSQPGPLNRGKEIAKAAVRMILFNRQGLR
jgi:6,7-dimethyl-8-ribityllumazine synthase